MKTLYSTVLIGLLTLGFLMTAIPGKAEARHNGNFSFSVVVPPFGASIGTPYYDDPVYAAPYYPVYRPYYYAPYYGSYYYRPYYRYSYWGHRNWRGDRHARHWR